MNRAITRDRSRSATLGIPGFLHTAWLALLLIGMPAFVQAQCPTWYIDSDGDGFGSSSTTTSSCTPVTGYVLNQQDCNDNSINDQEWSVVGGDVSGGSVITNDMVIGPDGFPVVAYQNFSFDPSVSQVTIKKFDGTNWVVLGADPVSTTEQMRNADIAVDNDGNLYMAYLDFEASGDTENKVTVRKYNTVTNTWDLLGTRRFSETAFVNGTPTLAIDQNDKVYLVYEKENSQDIVVVTYNTALSSWDVVGTEGFATSAVESVAIDTDAAGNVYVAFSDINDGRLSVMTYDGSTWTYVGTPGVSDDYIDVPKIEIDRSGVPYVAYFDFGTSQVVVKKYTGGVWTVVGGAPVFSDYASFVSLALDLFDSPVVAFRDNFGNTLQVMKLDGNGNWVSAVQLPYDGLILSLAIGNDNQPYLSFKNLDSSDRATLTRISPVPSPPDLPTVSASSASVCPGADVTLSVTAGDLNDAARWAWYSGSCGGTPVGSGVSIIVNPSVATTYYARAEGACLSAPGLCRNVAVGMLNPVQITQHPGIVTICENDDAQFTVTATGSGSLSYQWRNDGTDISGQTASTLSLTTVSSSFQGNVMSVVVTGICGSVASNGAALTVETPPAITTQPGDATICVNDPAQFEVTATGSNLTYQWRADGVDIVGETNATLALTNIPAADDGTVYDVVITGSCGNITSNGAALTVETPPAITTQPGDATVCVTDAAQFEVTATGSNLTYQWRADGVDIIGETAATLALNNIPLADDGTVYDVVITGSCGTLTSNGAVLTVETPPAITTQPGDATVCVNDAAQFEVTATGSNLTYQWRKDGVDIIGETNATLALTNIPLSDDGTIYDVVITGSCGTLTSNGAALIVETPPAITTHPGDATICVNDAAQFEVTATGSNLTYQWRADGVDIPGETAATLALTNIPLADDGTIYDVVITGSCGTLTSNGAALTVETPPAITTQPGDATVCETDATQFEVTATGSNLTYQWRADGVDIIGETTATLALNNIPAADDGTVYDVVITGSCGTLTSNGAALTVETPPAITTQPGDATVCETDATQFGLTATGSNLTYQWRADGVDIVGETNATLALTNIPLADDGTIYDVVITGSCGTLISNGAMLTVETPPAITTQPGDATVCETDATQFEVTATGSNLTYQWRADGVDIVGETTATLALNNIPAADDGTVYDVVITGSCGNITSTSAMLTVETPPAITTQPGDATVCETDATQFGVTATGSNLTYQWRADGVDIPGETNATLALTNIPLADDGTIYDVVITGSCGTLTSNGAILTVETPPAITTQPGDATVCETDATQFEVTATGSNLTYQWRADGVDIVGETTATLALNNIPAADDGTVYDVVITGSCGNITSTSAMLTVETPPAITTQPGDATVCETDATQFGVTATGSNLTYQWRADGVDIPGETNATLALTNIPLADDGTIYDVVITGSCGTLTSNGAILTVETPPAITTQPGDATVCETYATQFEVTATGSNLTYQWRADGVDIVGETTATLALTNIPLADDGTVYDVVITGSCGTLTSNGAALTVETPPAITTQPGDATVCEADATQFEVTATGSNLTYQWRADGVDIVGETTATLALNNIPLADDGTIYDVVITGSCGNITSNGAALTVETPPAITTQPGDASVCATGATQFEVMATGSNLTYQWRADGVDIVGETAATLTLNNIPLSDDGTVYDVVITGSCGNITSTGATLTVGTSASITVQPGDATVCETDATQFEVTATGSNLTYQWRADGVDIIGETNATLALNNIPAADDGTIYDVVITGGCGNITSNAATLTVETPPAITTQPGDATICVNDPAQFEVTATGSNLTYQWRADGVDIIGEMNATLALTNIPLADDGTIYDVVITGSCGNITSNGATLTVETPPAITTHPGDATICVNDPAQFEVTATGSNLTYQWRADGVDIVGETTATLALTNIPAADDGTVYDVVITGSCGNITSNGAMLTVETPPAITTQPGDATICVNDPAQFEVTATGSNLTYQWRADGVDIIGETTATLALTNIPLADDGTIYDVVITGSCGNTTSNGATLTVETPPAITTHPGDATICVNDPAQFEVTATGSNLTYQWRADGVDIVGETTATLALTNIPAADDGTVYDVVVTGSCGTLTSNGAALTVETPPAITAQPGDASVCSTGATQLEVTATGSNLTYQWRADGVDIIGETNATLALNNIPLADDGTVYDVVITGSCGTLTSNGATLTVETPPAITAQPGDASVCATGATQFEVTATGSNLTYQWRADGVDITGETNATLALNNIPLADDGTVYDVAITGSCGNITSTGATLTVGASASITAQPGDATVCVNDAAQFEVTATGSNLTYQWRADGVNITGETNATLALNNIPLADDGTVYNVVITGGCGNITSTGATLTVETPPAITTQPVDATVCVNDATQFEVTAMGSNLTYQWRADGVDITGETNATLALNNIPLADDGTVYDVVITGSCGTITSNGAELTVGTSASITNQPGDATICVNDATQFEVIATGANLTYQWRADGVDIIGETNATLALNNIPLADDGTVYDVVITGSCGSITSNGATLTVETPPAITAQPVDATVCVNDATQFEVTATGSNLTYQWRADGVDISGETNATLALNNIPLGDDGTIYDVVITGSCGTLTSNGATLTVETPPAITTQPGGVSVCATGATQLQVTATGANLTYQWRADGVDITGETNATLALTNIPQADDGTVYDVVITGRCGTITSAGAVLNVGAPVTITQQPADVSVCANGTASFSVVAAGAGLSYQWQVNGVDISGATSSTLILNNVLPLYNGRLYQVVITAGCGTLTSAAVSLAVQPGVTIAQQPVDVVVCEGGEAQFIVSANDPGYTYQWRANGADVPGATGTTFTLDDVALTRSGTVFDVRVTGTCGALVSNAAGLTVNPLPQVSAGPDLDIAKGTAATLQGQATGAGNLQFAWTPADFLDDPFAGQPRTAPSQNMRYTLTVTDQNGCTSFDDVEVTVLSSFVIPNAFSPNQDGTNDTWNIHGIEDYPRMTVEVMNRYGQIVYTSDPGYTAPWDGRHRGGDLPWGTYYYKIDLHNGDKAITGWLELLR